MGAEFADGGTLQKRFDIAKVPQHPPRKEIGEESEIFGVSKVE